MSSLWLLPPALVPAPPSTLSQLAPSLLALGFDFGTSGVRAAVVDHRGNLVIPPLDFPFPKTVQKRQTHTDWMQALDTLIQDIPQEMRQRICRIAVSGTSSTVLLCDDSGQPIASRGGPRMYDFSVAKQAPGDCGERALALLSELAPARHITCSATSSLAKLVAWHMETPLARGEQLVHQADFVAAQLMDVDDQSTFVSDWHNALKLGYDVGNLCYPEWMKAGPLGQICNGRLPRVVPPGYPIARVGRGLVEKWGFPPSCIVCGGTTDSNAAFLASNASQVGEAVTSLGSTLAIKMLSQSRVDDARMGVYSHRLGNMWLAGGASNVGCAVLREQGFTTEELMRLSPSILPLRKPLHPHYYPLPSAVTGERFPIADDSRTSVLEPRPDSRSEFLHSILHGIARVEAEGYATLEKLGASKLRRVLTCGGGAANDEWTQMRQHMLGVPTERAPETEACVGVALLASRGGSFK